MTAQGPTKRRTLLSSMRNGFRTQPAHLVRGSSRRIMSMRFRPANIRVINRRASSRAVICSAVQKQKAGFPLSRGKPALVSNRQTSGLDRSLHMTTGYALLCGSNSAIEVKRLPGDEVRR
jgi:hypothetical protein